MSRSTARVPVLPTALSVVLLVESGPALWLVLHLCTDSTARIARNTGISGNFGGLYTVMMLFMFLGIGLLEGGAILYWVVQNWHVARRWTQVLGIFAVLVFAAIILGWLVLLPATCT